MRTPRSAETRESLVTRLGLGPSSLPFIAFHLLTPVLAYYAGFSWTAVFVCIGSYYFRMLFCCIGYHRYFAHRTYQTGRIRQFLIAFFAQTTVQKGVLWWAAHHRRHHRYSDEAEDIHSVKQSGFWWAHVGWILSDKYLDTDEKRVRDLARFPELVWLNTHYWLPPTIYGAAIYLAGGWQVFVWGFMVSTVLLWHGTFTINSFMHMVGRRRFATSDESKNSLIFALVTCGEGWHNNHHRHPHSAAQGFYWWQIDTGYYALKVAEFLGIVRNVVEPTPEILAEGRKNPGRTLTPEAVKAAAAVHVKTPERELVGAAQ
jgi:stearoyl-CoA desaturase (delta-9 desaturase)